MENRIIKSPAARRYMYVVGVSLAALLVGYGLITAEHSGLWLSLLGAILGFNQVTSAVNTPEKPTNEEEGEITTLIEDE